MTIFLAVVALLIWMSYVSARDRGVPWFSLGTKSKPPCLSPPQSLPSQQRPPKRRFAQDEAPKARPTPQPKQDFSARAFYRLDTLTHNSETSQRLVERLQQRHPEKSLKWCVEKAICDIERDRMAR
jgi:hypothetical protein